MDPNLPTTAGDFRQLQQVFLNILNNAVDAVGERKEEGGEISIRTRKLADRIFVEFTDNGPPVQNPHRIFDPFYTTKPVGKGTGLGLSICYGILKEHGGEIEVRNLPHGVTFIVTLPLISAEALTCSEPAALTSDGLASRVLLVESEEVVLHLEQELLEKKSVAFRSASDASEALEFLKHESFDAAIIDVNMPGAMSASALYIWIEQNRPDLAPRVIFTASSRHDSDTIELPSRCGCPLLTKPIRVEDFWHALHKILATELSGSLDH